jgi:hypothetical protein
VGINCPHCFTGRLYNEKKPKTFVTFTGNPLFSTTLHIQHNLRCNGCKEYFDAELPEGVSTDRYSFSAKATAVVSRYMYGIPHYRLSQMQRAAGNPVSPTSLFEMSEDVMDAAYPVYRRLYWLAANGVQISYDDTGCKIISHILGTEGTKKTTHATGLVAITKEGQTIKLFHSSEEQAGKTVDELMRSRAPDAPDIVFMRDALAANNTEYKGKVDAKCVVHGRRNFWSIKENFPDECQAILKRIARIYWIDEICKALKVSDTTRLRAHKKYSLPLMRAVKRYAEFMLSRNKVEHNNELGKAFKYWNRHWMGLTAFCRVEGCPIDNNVAERWMKKYIRHRKNSLFYKTEMGALVGDILMSVGYTAAECNLDPHAYFIVLQENSEDVKTNPDNWLPWNYAARRNLEESSPQAA